MKRKRAKFISLPEDDRFDIISGGMSITEERKTQVDFADPFMTVGQTVLLNAKHKETIKSYKDLNDSKFVVVSKPGTTGEEAVRRLIPKATYYETDDTEIGWAMRVLKGTADAFVYTFRNGFSVQNGTDMRAKRIGCQSC